MNEILEPFAAISIEKGWDDFSTILGKTSKTPKTPKINRMINQNRSKYDLDHIDSDDETVAGHITVYEIEKME